MSKNTRLIKNRAFTCAPVGKNHTNGTAHKHALKNVLALVFSLFFIFSALLSSGVFLLINLNSKSNALTNANTYSIGNLLSDDGSSINSATVQLLVNKLGNDTTSTRKKNEINNDEPVVFKMGTVDGKDINWQVVYQAGDIITVWMTDCYTIEYFNYNRSIGTENLCNRELLDYTTGPYDVYCNYSQSVLRDVTKGIYTSLKMSYPVIQEIVKSPSEANATWQETQTEDIYFYHDSVGGEEYYKDVNYWCVHHNGLYSYSGMYNGWYDFNSCTGDEFWIPSYYEVYNASDHPITTGGEDDYISSQDSYWGLSDTDRKSSLGSLRSLFAGGTGYYFLRSSTGIFYEDVYDSGCMVDINTGKIKIALPEEYQGVRPACHISLSSLSAAAYSTIDVNTVNQTAISNVSSSRTDLSPTATVTATIASGYVPKVQYGASGYLTLSEPSGSGSIGNVNFTYTFTSNTLTINYSNLPAEEVTVYIDAVTTTTTSPTLNISINSNGGYTYKLNEDNDTNTKTLILYPSSGYYVNSVQINSGDTRLITYYAGQIVQDCPAHSVTYTANNTATDNLFTISFNRMTGNIDLVVNLSTTAPSLAAPHSALTVAVEATVGGEARVVGANTDDDTYTLVAVCYAGYRFLGWSVDGGASYLKDETGVDLGLSARIAATRVNGVIVRACFALNSAFINEETNNTDEIL